MFAIDTSAMMPWIFEDDSHAVASAAIDRAASEDLAVPAVWWFEVRNALIVGERRKRVTPEKTHGFLRMLAKFTIVIDREPDETAVLSIARRHGLTVYDAAYLELALRHSVGLATLDMALAKAASREAVELIGRRH